MATVHFYEKPGCTNNAKQKGLLQAAGHTVIAHNLLDVQWQEQPEKLRAFFGNTPVCEWFNYSAPAIKHGEIDPHQLCELEALSLLQKQPILIRRPLIEADGCLFAGFSAEQLESLLQVRVQEQMERCSKTANQSACGP